MDPLSVPDTGFRLPIGAGTDKMGEGIPVGSIASTPGSQALQLRCLAGWSEGEMVL
jgi:hypothetical protein